jgi:8-oxo-dGTP pyrophosphatase MutT (NUDIX family)
MSKSVRKEDTELDAKGIADKLSDSLKSSDYRDVQAAVVVLLRESKQGFEVLFVKRAESPTDVWSGQTALPGGKRSGADRDLKETAIRETQEETNINLRWSCRFLGAMEPLRSTQKPELKIIPYFVLQEKEQPIKLNEEHSDYFWTPLKELAKNKAIVKYCGKEFSAYIIEDRIIWGLTYRIIHKLLSLLDITD